MNQLSIQRVVVINIETAAAFPSFHHLNDEWKILWQEKIFHYLPDDKTPACFYIERAGVMAEFARIICISIGYFTNDCPSSFTVKSYYNTQEKELLYDFLTELSTINKQKHEWCFVGHNIKDFDIPFICRRMLINGMVLPSFFDFQNMKPWETNIIDTFQYWRFGDYKNFTSLKLLAAALGIPSFKEDIDGSKIGALYWNGTEETQKENLHRIVQYCEKDILTTVNLLLRLKGIPILQQEHLPYSHINQSSSAEKQKPESDHCTHNYM